LVGLDGPVEESRVAVRSFFAFGVEPRKRLA
jgi:hypothetical protein